MKSQFYMKIVIFQPSSDKTNPKPPKKNKSSKYKYVKDSAGYVSLYITSCEKGLPPKVDITKLKEAFPNINLDSIIETEYGLIINLLNDSYVNKILKLNLAKIFGKPVQVIINTGLFISIVIITKFVMKNYLIDIIFYRWFLFSLNNTRKSLVSRTFPGVFETKN